jgi:hypothetical protein
MARRQPFLREHGLSVFLLAAFGACWVAQGVAQWFEVAASGDPFWPTFWAATFENWQSEFLQLATFVLATKWLYERGSHESKDPEDATDP